jgi:hypothetical protein
MEHRLYKDSRGELCFLGQVILSFPFNSKREVPSHAHTRCDDEHLQNMQDFVIWGAEIKDPDEDNG